MPHHAELNVKSDSEYAGRLSRVAAADTGTCDDLGVTAVGASIMFVSHAFALVSTRSSPTGW